MCCWIVDKNTYFFSLGCTKKLGGTLGRIQLSTVAIACKVVEPAGFFVVNERAQFKVSFVPRHASYRAPHALPASVLRLILVQTDAVWIENVEAQ